MKPGYSEAPQFKAAVSSYELFSWKYSKGLGCPANIGVVSFPLIDTSKIGIIMITIRLGF